MVRALLAWFKLLARTALSTSIPVETTAFRGHEYHTRKWMIVTQSAIFLQTRLKFSSSNEFRILPRYTWTSLVLVFRRNKTLVYTSSIFCGTSILSLVTVSCLLLSNVNSVPKSSFWQMRITNTSWIQRIFSISRTLRFAFVTETNRTFGTNTIEFQSFCVAIDCK